MYGSMKVNDQLWVWDYVADEPVKEQEMPAGSERWKASEKKKYEDLKKHYEQNSIRKDS